MDARAAVTAILAELNRGQANAAEQLLPLLYSELRRMAAGQFARERPNHTLQPTALVHEAYLRLVDQQHVHWESKAHFLALAATMMRRILLDHARAHNAERRGAGARQVTLEDTMAVGESKALEMLQVDEALDRLAALDPQQARVVELRFFGGLSVEESAHVMKLSEPTIKRYWKSARAFLHRELTRGVERPKGSPDDSGALEAGS